MYSLLALSKLALLLLSSLDGAVASPNPAVDVVSAAPLQVMPRQANPFQTTVITTFAEPWSMAFLPDNRILVTEKAGTLRLVNPSTKAKGTITGVPAVRYGGQGGLGDVVLHPQFAQNSLLYFSYAEAGTNSSTAGAVVARARLVLNSSGGGALENVQVLWRQTPKATGNNHFSHRIAFTGTNSTMFISSGERELFYPAQDLSTNLGKIIRLNDDGSIPAGNPFASMGGIAAQIWSYGSRNILGLDFDSQGRLWEIEMGPLGGDEVNLIKPSLNYGWPLVSEGSHYNGTLIPKHSTRPDLTPPKVSWSPVISPASMIVYKGDLFAQWKGNVIISALGAMGLVRVEINGESAREVQRMGMGTRMRCVRQSNDGAVWTLEDGASGRLLKLTPN